MWKYVGSDRWRTHVGSIYMRFNCKTPVLILNNWLTDWTLGLLNQRALHVKIRRVLSLAHPWRLHLYTFSTAKHGFSYWTTDGWQGFVKSRGFPSYGIPSVVSYKMVPPAMESPVFCRTKWSPAMGSPMFCRTKWSPVMPCDVRTVCSIYMRFQLQN